MKDVELTEELAKVAVRFGYIGLFSHRSSLQKAIDGSMAMIETMEEKALAMTAMAIVLNTTALIRAQQLGVVNELRELARATTAYCVEDSRSGRRRDAMISGAEEALRNAEEVFGPEET